MDMQLFGGYLLGPARTRITSSLRKKIRLVNFCVLPKTWESVSIKITTEQERISYAD